MNTNRYCRGARVSKINDPVAPRSCTLRGSTKRILSQHKWMEREGIAQGRAFLLREAIGAVVSRRLRLGHIEAG